jgi:hypothetical protein
MADQKSISTDIRKMLRTGLSAASRANFNCWLLTWGSAALHPRLYAAVRSADCGPEPPHYKHFNSAELAPK